MKTVFVLFDSLNRLALEAYGGTAIATPNFYRFSKKAVTFDKHYVGSLPCMPARRDMHTGRLNFMHRHWGPLEPFDDSFARILSQNGTYTHMISDHLHYFEDGGWGYANAFDSWDYIRGQEYDPIKAMVQPPIKRYKEKFDTRHYPMENLLEDGVITRGNSPHMEWKKSRAAINHDFLKEESDFPTAKCFASAFEFLDINADADNWFLQLECFDPHEPFVSPERFREAYNNGYEGKILDWPLYEKSANSPEEIAHIRGNYAALVAMCDEYFGKLLDYFDEHDLWKDTCLMLTTDHGFLLSEHDWWGKNRMPYYEEISHIPLMMWHPQHASSAGARRENITQTPDLMPTILDIHDCPIPNSVTGKSLLPLLNNNTIIHDDIVLGMFSGPVCIVDDTYSYFLYPDDITGDNLYIYTLMPTHMTKHFDMSELQNTELAGPFDFTKGAQVLKVRLDPSNGQLGQDGHALGNDKSALYNLVSDPGQTTPINDAKTIERLNAAILKHFDQHDVPDDIYTHFGLAH